MDWLTLALLLTFSSGQAQNPMPDATATERAIKAIPKRKYGRDVPKWARVPAKIAHTADGHTTLSAVGVAETGKLQALGRDTAQNRARTLIVNLLDGKTEGSSGTLVDAKVMNTFESKRDGNTYVLVEAPVVTPTE